MTTVSERQPLDGTRERSDFLESQVQELWDRAPIGFAATLVNSLILVGVLREQVDSRPLWGWFVALCLVTAFRFGQMHRYRHAASISDLDSQRWDLYFTVGIGVSGVVWGASALFLFSDSIPHQVFLAFVLGGMVAGASATFSARMPAFFAFSIPAVMPLSVRFFLEGDELHVAMGAMILLFGVLLSGTAYRVHSVTTNSLELRNELGHAHLHLHSESQHAEALSEELRNAKAALSSQDKDLGELVVHYMVEVTDIITTLQDRLSEPFETKERALLHRHKSASLTTFARGLAHHAGRPVEEIRENLARVWKKPERYPSLELLTRTLVAIENANDNLDDLVQELTRYGATGVSSCEEVDLSVLAKSVTEHWKNEARYEGTLWTDCSETPAIEADRLQVGLVLERLLSNAQEAISPAEGSIEIATDVVQGRIDFTHAYLHLPTRATRYAVVSVTDNGVGIPAETQERIFDPFFTTKPAKRGFRRGLGLTTVAAVMRQHGGEITIQSRPLEGTTVRLFFPVA